MPGVFPSWAGTTLESFAWKKPRLIEGIDIRTL